MLDIQNIGDVERTMLGFASLFHRLCVQIPRWGHQNQGAGFLCENKARVADLAARHQEVEARTEGVFGQVVHLGIATKRFMNESYCLI